MNKQQAINSISGLYPIDSNFQDTNAVGKQLLLESMEEADFDWRDLPESVLVKWAEKCEFKELADDRRMNQKYKA